MQGERGGLTLIFMCICQLSRFPSTIIEDDDDFSPLYILGIFLLNRVAKDVWVLNSIKLVIPFFVLVAYHYNNYNSVIGL